jgi:hypothetical protein
MDSNVTFANQLDVKEQFRVHAWRAERLRGLGVSPLLADVFADLVDWRAVASLVDRGCSPQLALEIVR